MELTDAILKLSRQLYPTGRAFRFPVGGDLEKMHKGLAVSEAKAYQDALGILNSILPDNDFFTAQDAADWERRLGLITNEAVSLTDRKAAIKRKMNHPGVVKARQHYLYIQGQLRAAGFDVYVHENRFPDGMGGYVSYDPLSIVGTSKETAFQHGDLQHGDFQHGSSFNAIIANHIDEAKDKIFDIPSYESTFFIGASYLGVYASVDKNRKDEFRQLILKLKPVQMVGFLFINYV